MGQITAGDIKSLRERTGAGMMDCKKALVETNGDINAAIDYLRKKGLSAVAKKAGRIAAEGLVVASSTGHGGAILEVNSETDFVAKNKEFQDFVNHLLEIILTSDVSDVEALMKQPYDGKRTVSETLTEMVARIGENISIRRFEKVGVTDGIVAAYVHAGGKIAVVVGIDTRKPEQMASVGRDIAMHVAASNPQYISREDVPAQDLEREKSVLRERALASGKPEKIIERIVTGQLNKYYIENCLLEQPFVKDPDQSVSQLLSATDPDATISVMCRYQLGEGIEKRKSDFAAEVSAQIHG
jgi:elongation factor Ts